MIASASSSRQAGEVEAESRQAGSRPTLTRKRRGREGQANQDARMQLLTRVSHCSHYYEHCIVSVINRSWSPKYCQVALLQDCCQEAKYAYCAEFFAAPREESGQVIIGFGIMLSNIPLLLLHISHIPVSLYPAYPPNDQLLLHESEFERATLNALTTPQKCITAATNTATWKI